MRNDYAGKYDEFSIDDFSRLMAGGKLSSVDLVEYYIDRISRIDAASPESSGTVAAPGPGRSPGLNSVLHMNAEAVAIAENLDKERRRGLLRGPLHGIPLLIKGNIDTGDTMPTTAGSLALKKRLASSDAALVARLRAVGAVILGKTNLSEWANFRSTRSSSGWSSEGGQTKNPYALDRNPSGSSSGSAVAVSANLCPAAVGTETDGSIISPSSVNGIVGIKPTVGAISREGIIPISFSQDTAGPMARTVRDAAILLGAMADPGTLPDIVAALDSTRGDLRGIRLGVARNFCGFNPDVDNIFGETARALRGLGAELIDIELKTEKNFEEAEFEVMLYEFNFGITKYLRENISWEKKGDVVSELIAFNRVHAKEVMPWFGQEIFEVAATKRDLSDDAYKKARALCIDVSRENGIDAAIKSQSLDAIIAPSGGPAWKTDHLLGDHYSGGGCTSLPAVAGYPHISVPAGFIHGLPVGLSVFGAAFSEPVLIRIALAFESAAKVRRPPLFAATLG